MAGVVIVVSDTSCISNLLIIGRADLLSQLFGEVVIPVAVRDELRVKHPSLPAFVNVGAVSDHAAVAALSARLDEGEAEAIVLACELKADFLLMDETDGREEALRRGLHVIGLLGVLVEAKRLGFLPEVRPLLDRLERDAVFWFSAKIRQQILTLVGEA